MPFRTKNTVSAPGAGTVNTRKKTYTGRGRAPAGTRKVAAKKPSEVPTVTTTSHGRVTASGFSNPVRAAQAVQRARSSRRRVAEVESHDRAAAYSRRTQARSQRSSGGKAMHAPMPAPHPEPVAQVTRSAPPKVSVPKLKGTPQVRRKVRTKLQGAKRTLRHTPTLEGPLQPDQRRFDEAVAKRTKLNPRTVGAQSLAEESSTAAAQRQAEGNQNWLNIGPGAQLAPTPKGAAKETAQLINTGPSYGGIRASRGKGPQRQIEAIAASPWGTAGSTMQGTLPLVGISPAKKAAKGRVRKLTARARSLGMKTGSPEVGGAEKVSKQALSRFKVAKKVAAELTSAHIPYVWGGGHGSFSDPRGGLDCSGAVSYVLHKMGVLSSPLTSGAMGSVLKPGPGAVTVFYNSTHTFMRIGNEYWGTSVGDSGAGGLGPHPMPSKGYLAQYNVGHVAGLGKKVAVALGLPTGGGSFPGMTLSPSGTTASIAPGAGSVRQGSRPGFSSSPIRLSPVQKARRTLRELASLGAGVGEGKGEEAPSRAGLRELERKYGSPAV